MPKVNCAVLECRHNVDDCCTASKISLSEHGVNTRYQGYQQYWKCKTYEMSDEAKEFYKELENLEVC